VGEGVAFDGGLGAFKCPTCEEEGGGEGGEEGGGVGGGEEGGGLGIPPFRTKGAPSELNWGGKSDNTIVSSAGLEGVC
jgi:hypothetical protein